MKTLFKNKSFILFSAIMFGVFGLHLFGIAGSLATGMTYATLPVAGNFDCAALQVIQGKADMIWLDNATNKDYVPKAEALRIIAEQTTAKLGDINGEQAKDNTIKVSWINNCTMTAADCSTTACIVEGDELSADCKSYAPNICKTVAFVVNEDTFRTSTFSPEEIIAKGLLKATKTLDEALATAVIAALDTMKGVNAYFGDYGAADGTQAVGTANTKIDPTLWTAGLFGYFNLASSMNKFQNAFLLSGTNLAIAFFNAQAQFANADGKGDLNKFQTMPMQFDTFNLDTVLSPSLMTYMIDRGALAFIPKWRYSSTPRIIPNVHTRYTMPSRTLPNMQYDVIYLTRCKSGTNQIEHVWNITARAGVYLNPTGCTATNTGILGFIKKA